MYDNSCVTLGISHGFENKLISFPGSVLPEDKHISVRIGKQFTNFVTTIEALYSIGAEAIEKFNQLELHLFDSLATDCACHMRALHIAYLAKVVMAEPKFQQELKSHLTALQEKRQQAKELYDSLGTMANAEKLKRFKNIISLFSENPTISEILRKLNLMTFISAKVHFLINAYLLTIVKDKKLITEKDKINCLISGTLLTEKDNIFREVTNPKALSDYARKLVNNKAVVSSLLEREVCVLAKKKLVEASASFILQATARSCSVLQGYFLEENRKMVQGKPELPDYYSLTAVFLNALYEKIPVVLIINKYRHLGHVYREAEAKSEITMLLVPSENRAYFQPQTMNSANLALRSPIIVVIAKATYVDADTYLQKLMSNFNFIRLCQLDGVQHKQYTNSPISQRAPSAIPSLKLEKFQEEAKKLGKLYEEACQVGSSIHSSNANFVLSHIFADIMHNYSNSSYTAFFDKAANCFSKFDEEIISKLKETSLLTHQFRAADTRKLMHSFSFLSKPLEECLEPRFSSTMPEATDEKMQQIMRNAFSQPHLHHSLRSEEGEVDVSQRKIKIGAPIPIRLSNQVLHNLSEHSMTDCQYNPDFPGRPSPVLSEMFSKISPNPLAEIGRFFPPLVEFELSPSLFSQIDKDQ